MKQSSEKNKGHSFKVSGGNKETKIAKSAKSRHKGKTKPLNKEINKGGGGEGWGSWAARTEKSFTNDAPENFTSRALTTTEILQIVSHKSPQPSYEHLSISLGTAGSGIMKPQPRAGGRGAVKSQSRQTH